MTGKSSEAWYWRIYRPHVRNFMGMTVFFILKSACVWISPIIMARLIDIASSDDPERWSWAMALVGLQLGLVLLNYPTALKSAQLQSRLSRGVSLDLRLQVCQRIHDLGFLQQSRFREGKLYAKAIRDVEMIEQFPKVFLNQILSTSMTLLIILASILWRAPEALWVFVASIPMAVFLRMYFLKNMQAISSDYRLTFETMSSSLHNQLTMNTVTKAHGLEAYAMAQLKPRINDVYRVGRKFDFAAERMGAASFVSFTLIQVLFLLLSIWMCVNRRISVGDIVMFNSFFASISGSFMGLIGTLPLLSQMRESSRSLDELLSLPVAEEDHGVPVPTTQGHIEFRQVSYRYPESIADAVHDMNFSIKPGQALAVVGPSGCGKSTLLAMVLGFLKPQRGQILLDGLNLSSLNLRDFRQHIGVVTQEIALATGSIYENVAYGKPGATEAEVMEALQQAEAWSFVSSLPNGIHATLGEDGIRLSGGQKQRLALARALIRNPRILILDEATSAMDVTLEDRLQKTLKRLMVGRTTFIVSQPDHSRLRSDSDHG
ncbi:MAG: ABC transporter ATP-binding protein/permease [Pseudobdellovibrionaceae bacterium]|nr:ABC transporter ATP-binding protein/permease [Pseudobdellovibrionaceae bacterium]